MNKEKGFTLIELLAVIVVLSIILVISIPKVLNVIEEAEKRTFGESANLIGDAARLKYTTSALTEQIGNETYRYENNELTEESPELKYKGEKPKSGIIKQEKGRVSFALISKNGKYCAIKKKNEKVSKVYTIKGYFEKGDCTPDYVDKLRYYIEFDANHGHTNISKKRVTYEEAYGELPEATREKHIFKGWYTEKTGGQKVEETTIVTKNKEHTLYAHWEEIKYTVTFKNDDGSILQTETLNVGEIPEYKGATPTKAQTAQYIYTFKGWNKVIEAVLEDTEYIATYTNLVRNYTVTYRNPGSVYGTQTVEYGKTATKPSNPSKEGYTFKYWSATENGSEYNFNTQITGDITLYAVYESDPTKCPSNNVTVSSGIICKRATTLHTETCSGGGACSSKYNYGDQIIYNNCGTRGILRSGDAFDCDVNGDGVYNAQTERFYYVSDYYNTSTKGFESDTAVLIYYNNTVSGVANNKVTGNPSYNTSLENYTGPTNIKTHLPTTSQWSNVSLKNTTRAILNELNTNVVYDNYNNEHQLPTSFSYSGYAARHLTIQELKNACSGVSSDSDLSSLKNCDYLFENGRYSSQMESTMSSGYWLETVSHNYNMRAYIIAGRNVALQRLMINGEGINPGVRPVIEVSKSKISY